MDMSNTLSPEEVDRIVSRASDWRRASSAECVSADKSVGYIGYVDNDNIGRPHCIFLDRIIVGVYWTGGIFRDSYEAVVSADGFTVGYSWGLDREKVKGQFERAEAAYEASLSRAKEQALARARQLSA